jgi:hypothetical protein
MQPLNTLSASTIMDLLWAGKQDDARKLVTANLMKMKELTKTRLSSQY